MSKFCVTHFPVMYAIGLTLVGMHGAFEWRKNMDFLQTAAYIALLDFVGDWIWGIGIMIIMGFCAICAAAWEKIKNFLTR